jgi:hypothetical protein
MSCRVRWLGGCQEIAVSGSRLARTCAARSSQRVAFIRSKSPNFFERWTLPTPRHPRVNFGRSRQNGLFGARLHDRPAIAGGGTSARALPVRL